MNHALADILYPPRCLLCQQAPEGSAAFCPACSSGLFNDPHLLCPRCAARVGPFALKDGACVLCKRESIPFSATVRLGPYSGPLQQAVLFLKHSRNEWLAELLGERLAEIHRARLVALQADFIVPVPLYWVRRLRRGYNQSASIAHGLGQRLGLRCHHWRLWQMSPTKPQKTLSARQRKENVKGAYRAWGRLDGKHVLLVDDVMTTGATAAEAARALLRAGAAKVSVAVLARADG